MTRRGRPRTDCPASSTERSRLCRERKRRGLSVLPQIELTAARQKELAALLGLEPDSTPADIAAALANAPVDATRCKSARSKSRTNKA